MITLDTLLHRTKSALIMLCALLLWVASSADAQDDNQQNPVYEMKLETASAVAWSPDSEVLAIGDTTGIRLYTETLDFIDLLEQPTDEIKALTWSPDGQYLAVVGVEEGWHQSDVYVWDYETREPVTIFDRHEFMVPMLAWSPDSKQIASASWDKTVQVWNALTGEIQHILSVEDSLDSTEAYSVTWSPTNGQIAAIVGLDLVIWNTDNGELVRSITSRPFPPHFSVVRWSPDGRYWATNFNVLDAVTGEEVSTFRNCPRSVFMDWHLDSQIMAIFTQDVVYICDVLVDKILMTLDGGIGQKPDEVILGYLNAVDWHPDGKRLVSVSFDGMVQIWQVFED